VKKLTIEDCRDLAESRGGKFLSTKYINANTKYLWECENEHQWEALYSNVQQGYWCPYCAGNAKKTIEDCYKLAEQKNGKCLSVEYVNNKIKMLWQCEKDHQWKTSYGKIKNCNSWCPYCVGRIITIKDCHKLAKQKNGKCLSKGYKNNNTKYLWQCENGHQFEMTYNKVQQEQWCPICGREQRKKTMLNKYGVEHSMQNKEIALKQAKSSNYSHILYHWLTGEELICTASYEKAVVEYLNFRMIEFDWQPKIFEIKELNTTYRPDLYLIKERKYIEIKGYFRKGAKQKWGWFQENYPNSELWDKKKLEEIGIL
jgi:hypothetical protein